MRYAVIIGLLLFSCKAGKTIGTDIIAGSFVILVQYYEQQTEQNILNLLPNRTRVQQFDVHHSTIFINEIEASCIRLKAEDTNALWKELKNTAGVTRVVFNPRY